MSTITINGNTISGNLSGRNISITNNKIIIDGVDVTPDSKEINITVSGNIEKLSADCCNKIQVTGDVGSVKTQSGDVEITGNVNGSIQSMSGSVDCGNVSGNISTMSGSVKHKKV